MFVTASCFHRGQIIIGSVNRNVESWFLSATDELAVLGILEDLVSPSAILAFGFPGLVAFLLIYKG